MTPSSPEILRDRLKELKAAEATQEALAKASGITKPAILEELLKLGIRGRSLEDEFFRREDKRLMEWTAVMLSREPILHCPSRGGRHGDPRPAPAAADVESAGGRHHGRGAITSPRAQDSAPSPRCPNPFRGKLLRAMNTEPRVLVVDDEPDMVDNCVRILRRAGYRCLSTTDPHRALTLLESERPDLLITDLKMPEVDGLALLRRAHELDAALPVVVITAFATIESAVAAIRMGLSTTCPRTSRWTSSPWSSSEGSGSGG